MKTGLATHREIHSVPVSVLGPFLTSLHLMLSTVLGNGYSHCHYREVKRPLHLDLASQAPLLMQLSLVLDPAQDLAAID